MHEDERSVRKADDSMGRGKGRLSRTHVLHRSRRVLLGGCPGSHREGQVNSSLSSGLRDKLPEELKFHLLEKVQGKQRFGGHPGFIRKSHGKQTFQKSPGIIRINFEKEYLCKKTLMGKRSFCNEYV